MKMEQEVFLFEVPHTGIDSLRVKTTCCSSIGPSGLRGQAIPWLSNLSSPSEKGGRFLCESSSHDGGGGWKGAAASGVREGGVSEGGGGMGRASWSSRVKAAA